MLPSSLRTTRRAVARARTPRGRGPRGRQRTSAEQILGGTVIAALLQAGQRVGLYLRWSFIHNFDSLPRVSVNLSILLLDRRSEVIAKRLRF